MKDLKQLEKYRVEAPRETVRGFNAIFLGEMETYSFEFPSTEFMSSDLNEQQVIKTIISVNRKTGKVQIAASVYNSKQIMRSVTPNEMYTLKDYLLDPNENLVWYYDPRIDDIREVGFKVYTGQKFDMTNFVQHMLIFKKDYKTLLQEAYSKKVQKNKGYTYARGNVGENRYIHVQVKECFPWETLKIIAKREFGNRLVSVFFNEETKKHPNEYIIW